MGVLVRGAHTFGIIVWRDIGSQNSDQSVIGRSLERRIEFIFL